MQSNDGYESIPDSNGRVTNLELLQAHNELENASHQHHDGRHSEESSYQTAYDPIAALDSSTHPNRDYSYGSDNASIATSEGGPMVYNVGLNDEEKNRSLHAGYINTDPYQGHRATEIKFFTFSRPHMRGFHGSWMCSFAAFFIWLSIAPLLPIVKESLKLSHSDVWLSNMCSATGTVIMRFTMGPLCDKYGAKTVMTRLIAICTIPCLLTGAVHNLTTLCIMRFLVSCVGGTFVTAQYWLSCMFTEDVVGAAVSTSSGWGEMGSAFANIVIGTVIHPFILNLRDGDEEVAWRTSFILPSILTLFFSFYFYVSSDDSPYGDYRDLKKIGLLPKRSDNASFHAAMLNLNSWILFFQYGASFGVELTMEYGMALYLFDTFGLSVENAAMYASLFGLTNIFSQSLGCYLSDSLSHYMSLRGRLLIQMFCLFMEGILILHFGSCKTLQNAIFTMVFFSTFTQMSMGTCFQIVPYVDGTNTGPIAGIVGAGGSVGAIYIGNVFRTNTYEYSFTYMGMFVIIMALLTPFINIKNYATIFCGKDKPEVTLLVPHGA